MEIYQPMTPDKKIYKCSNFPPYYNVLLFIIVFTENWLGSVSMTVCIEVHRVSGRTGTHSDMIDNLDNMSVRSDQARSVPCN